MQRPEEERTPARTIWKEVIAVPMAEGLEGQRGGSESCFPSKKTQVGRLQGKCAHMSRSPLSKISSIGSKKAGELSGIAAQDGDAHQASQKWPIYQEKDGPAAKYALKP